MNTALLIAAFHVALSAPPGTANNTLAPERADRHSTSMELIRQGRPSLIIHPAGQEWRTLAERLAQSLSRLAGSSGIQATVMEDTQAIPNRLGPLPPHLRNQPLIILGNVQSNRAMFPLYANYYTYCDAKYPGGDGWIIQTIVRPFGGPGNYLIVGGSTPRGVERAVDTLINRLDLLSPADTIELPWSLTVELGGQMPDLVRPALANVEKMKLPTNADISAMAYDEMVDAFTTCAHLYFYTGRVEVAEKARAWALHLANQKGGFRCGDYSMEILAAAWRRIRPVFTPEESALVDKRFVETVTSHSKSWWRQTGAIPEIGGRHHTTGMLAWWEMICSLLEAGQIDEPARKKLMNWQRECEGYLDGLLRHNWDDLDDYQSADSAQNACSYALQTGKLEWFHDGLARHAAEKLLALTDNQGWYVGVQGYGEALPGWERFTLNGGLLLGACAFIYEEPAYRALIQQFPPLNASWGALQPWGLRQFACSDAATLAQPPEWLTGLRDVRLTPYRLDLMNRGVFLNSPLMDGFAVVGLKPPGIPDHLVYDKAVLRREPPGPFLLLQGMSGIALSTIDMNSVIRYTDQDRIWLVHNTSRRSLFFKNAVYVSNGLNDEPIPAACELLACDMLGDVAFISSRLPDYRGTQWTRNIIQINHSTAVIDRVHVDRPGQYTVSCNWRTPDWADFGPGGWTSNQDGAEFRILPSDMTGAISHRFPAADGATRPTVLREVRQCDARSGEDLFFENVLYSQQKIKEIRRPAPGVILVRDEGDEDSVVLFAAGDGIQLADLHTDAMLTCVSGDTISLLQASSLRLGANVLLASDARVNKQLQSPEIRDYLRTLWNACATESATVKQARSASTGPQPAWTHPGPSSRGSLIDGVRLTGVRNFNGSALLATDWILPAIVAEPRLSPLRGSSLTAGTALAHTLEPMLEPLENSEIALHLPRKTNIAEIELIGATGKETSAPMPARRMEFELTFSSDAFRKDLRKQQVIADRATTWHNLYKGRAYAFENYRLNGFEEEASEVRVRIVQADGADRMPMNDIRVRAADSSGQLNVQTRAFDLDGDGTEDLLVWTTEGEICIVGADGRDIWRRNFGTSILAVDAWDLEDDGRKEILVSLSNWKLHCFNLDGSHRWESNWADIDRRDKGGFFGDGNLVFGMAAWSTPSARKDPTSSKELMLTSYFCASRADANGNFIDSFRRYGHNTQIRPIPDGLPYAGGLVTRSDIPWNGGVPVEWLDPATGKKAATCTVPNGPCVLLEVGDYTGRKQAEVLVATEQGIGIYTPQHKNPVWEHYSEAAVSGAAVIPADNPGRPAQVIYGRQDGYMFVVAADGQLIRQLLLDEPINCLTALKNCQGKPVVLVGTLRHLLCIRLDDLQEEWRIPGEYQTLVVLKHADRQHATGVLRSGRIHLYTP